jgi:hypothetical protein
LASAQGGAGFGGLIAARKRAGLPRIFNSLDKHEEYP